jgi:hypothetical protein
MFKKSSEIINKVELKKSKSLGVYEEVKSNIAKKGYHYTGSPKAKSNAGYDLDTYNNISNNYVIEPVIKEFNDNVTKSKEIENTIQQANSIALVKNVKNSYNISNENFKMAVKHECFYDVISENDGNVTIIFLPITTSSNRVLCGIQKFDKIHLFKNGLKHFYLTRLLYQKTMSREDFIK